MEKAVILQKQAEVEELTKKFESAKVVVTFSYQGLTVEQFQTLRRNLRANGSYVAVVKNNISRRASAKAGYEEFQKELSGPRALVFNDEDPVSPAKELTKFAKDNEKVVVGGAIVEGKVVGVEKVVELASLPNKNTLLTQLAAGMYGTLSQLAIGLNMIATKEE